MRYCAQARCVENQIYVAIAGSVGNLPFVDNLDIHYAQSGIFTPSDIPFTRDAIAAECSPNIETVIFQDLDLELLRTHKQSGSVLNWNDRRKDLYEVKYLREPRGDGFLDVEADPNVDYGEVAAEDVEVAVSESATESLLLAAVDSTEPDVSTAPTEEDSSVEAEAEAEALATPVSDS